MNEVMIENDAALVFKIPLNRQSKLDRMIWRDSIIREFMVKSTYHVARIVLGKEDARRELRKRVWRRIWMAKVASKIKYFTWRLVQKVIPIQVRLQKKGVITDISCAVCGSQSETIKHVFFEFRMNREVWSDICHELGNNEDWMEDL